jgi:hypothetical protein
MDNIKLDFAVFQLFWPCVSECKKPLWGRFPEFCQKSGNAIKCQISSRNL